MVHWTTASDLKRSIAVQETDSINFLYRYIPLKLSGRYMYHQFNIHKETAIISLYSIK